MRAHTCSLTHTHTFSLQHARVRSEFFDFPALEGGNYSAAYDFFGGNQVALNAQHELYTGVKEWMLCEDLADVLR